MPRAQTTAFILSQFMTGGAVHFMGLHEQDYFGSQPDPEKRNITTLPVPQSLYNKPFNESESLYEEIDESQVQGQKSTYTFADPDNCLIEHPTCNFSLSTEITFKSCFSPILKTSSG